MNASSSISVEHILAEYARATDKQRVDGRAWYPAAGAIIDGLASWADVEPGTVAAVVAALSPRNPWRWNIQDSAAILHHARHGGALPKVTTFNDNRDKAIAFVNGAADWKSSALKVRSFVRNMTGDAHAVTVDVWAIRVASGGALSTVENDADYRAAEAAYRHAAVIVGETPRDLQAIVWLSAQARGLASNRIGRHDATYKKGTLSIVAELFGADFQEGLGL
jgi:hypothetical protein